MALIHDLMVKHMPVKRRMGSKGWVTCNAVCCHHRGHKQDQRFRGNFLFTPEGSIVYNCYNCGFKTVYDGLHLSRNFESLMGWIGVPDDDIKRIKLEMLNDLMNGQDNKSGLLDLRFTTDFKETELPDGAIPFDSLIMEDDPPEKFLEVISYMSTRGDAVLKGWNYHWSAGKKSNMHSRVIVPFYYRNKVVGWTARYAGTPPSGVPRYYNSQLQVGYIFNSDVLYKPARKYVTVHEGPFDAISVDGVAMLGSEPSREQISWLNSTDKEKIIVPDRQRNNQGLIDAALENGWHVSFPEWEEDVKDSADATKRYGKIFTLKTIMDSKTKNGLQIGIKRRMFR